MTEVAPQQDINPRKKLYSALVGNANPEAKNHFKQFSFEQFNKRLDDEKFVEDLYESLRSNDVVLDAKNRQPEQNYYDFIDAYVKVPTAKPAAKPAAPVAEKEKSFETGGKNYAFVGQPQTGEMDVMVVDGKSIGVPQGMTMVPEGEEIPEVEYEGQMLPEVTATPAPYQFPEPGTLAYEKISKSNPPIGSPEYDFKIAMLNQPPSLQLGPGGYTQEMAAGLPETMEKAKQSSLSPVFKDYEVAQKMMKGEVPLVTQKDVRKAQRGFGAATKEQQEAAIMGGTGAELAQQREDEKLTKAQIVGEEANKFLSGLNRAIYKTPSAMAKTIGELGVGVINMLGGDMKSEESVLYSLADKYDKWLDTSEVARDWIGDPQYRGLATDVGSGLGQIATMIAAGPGGASRALMSRPGVIKSVAQKMFSKPSLIAGAQVFNSEYENMKAKGESDETAFKQALTNWFATAPLENLPIVNLAERLNKTVGVQATRRIINAIQQGAEEGGQEALQQLFSNFSNNALVELNKNVVDWTEGLQPSAEAGGVVGLLIGALANAKAAKGYSKPSGLSAFSPVVQENPIITLERDYRQENISRAEKQGKKPDKWDVKHLQKLMNDPEAWVKEEIEYFTQKIKEDKKANIDTKRTEADLAEHNALLAQIKAEKKGMSGAAPVTPEAPVAPAETIVAPETAAPITEEVPAEEVVVPPLEEDEDLAAFGRELEAIEQAAPVAPAEEEVVAEEVPAEQVAPEAAPEIVSAAPVEEVAPEAPAAPAPKRRKKAAPVTPAPVAPEKEEGEVQQEPKAAQKIGSLSYTKNKKAEGDKDTRTLGDGTKIKGTYKIVSADDVLASHNEQTFSQTPGFPTTPDGKTANDRDYKTDTQAQAQVQAIASTLDERAIDQTPVVTADGIVLDGNNRTMSRKLAAKLGTDNEYAEGLKRKLKRYGLPENALDGIPNPMLVFELETPLPYTTETFSLFNKQEKKEKGPIERAVEISKRASDRFKNILAQVYEEAETPSEVSSDPKKITKIKALLQEEGIVGSNEFPRYFNEDNTATKEGVSFLETLVLGAALNENTIRTLDNPGMGNVKNIVLKSIIPLIRNSALGKDSLIPDIIEGIEYLSKAKFAKMSPVEMVSQTTLVFAEVKPPSPEALMIAITLEGGFKDFLKNYNNSVGTTDIFRGEQTKKVIIEDNLKAKIKNYEQVRQNLRLDDTRTKGEVQEGDGKRKPAKETEPSTEPKTVTTPAPETKEGKKAEAKEEKPTAVVSEKDVVSTKIKEIAEKFKSIESELQGEIDVQDFSDRLRKRYEEIKSQYGEAKANEVLKSESNRADKIIKESRDGILKRLKGEYFKKNGFAPSSIKEFQKGIDSGEYKIDDLPSYKDAVSAKIVEETKPSAPSFTSQQSSEAATAFDKAKTSKGFDKKYGKGAYKALSDITKNFEDIMDKVSEKIKQDCIV